MIHCHKHKIDYGLGDCPMCIKCDAEELKGGTRNNEGKAQLSMVLEAKYALNGCAAVLEMGAKKYSRGNWRKGLNHNEVVDSLLRHLTEYMSGGGFDEESGLLHVDHILCNALFLAELTRTHPNG